MASIRPANEPQLEVDRIQGDILVGLQKDKQTFISFEIVDVVAFKAFLKLLAPRVTSMRVVLEREFILETQSTARTSERFSFVGVTIGFSFDGLTKLGVPGLDAIKDVSFRAGLAASSPALNDPSTGAGAPASWLVGGPGQPLHGLLTVAGPLEPMTGPHHDPVDAQVAFLKGLAGSSWRILREEAGKVREDARGHEHFGFLDGVSQPAVRGQIDAAFPGRTFLNPGRNPDDVGQGFPGQDLVQPGEFVFGYPGQDDSSSREGGPRWMRDGSFQVYRRLRQLVPEFEAFVDAQATTLGMDAELLAARMVGRWKSGAPLVTAPLQDNPQLGADALVNNAFEYSQDKDGRRCPFAAHIRKSYPRNDINPNLTGRTNEFDKRDDSEAFAERRRIMRAGIPYGEPVSDDEKRTKASSGDASLDRGLMFISYQTCIVDQFEFILKQWVNSPDFARKGVGEDPILGQATGTRARSLAGAVPPYPAGGEGPVIQLPTDFIVPTGGGYFFVPSIATLTDVCATEADPEAAEAVGFWGDVMEMPNVPVHAHLLPDGNVLFWGRREDAKGSMDQHVCTPQIWDRNVARGPNDPPVFRPTLQPKLPDGSTVNLFCAGHSFLPDGTLLVAGGHLQDSHGVNQACLYDWRADTWTPLPPMNNGRWYPTVTALADGAALVTSGSFGQGNQTPNNKVPQVWDGTKWTELADQVVSLFPRNVVLGDGRVFVAGSDPDAFFLDALQAGTWSAAPNRSGGDRQYAPALLFAPNRVAFMGGGNDPDTNLPTQLVEVIDFGAAAPAWTPATPMTSRRRQHNATLLPDGTVLVTGGSKGGGFNDLEPGGPVHEAELWDTVEDTWTPLAAEDEDRCYHSVALLLPDATVLSAGGGEYFTHDGTIDDKDVHKTGQVFSPPYLSKGERPVLTGGPDGAEFGATFRLGVGAGPSVARLTALRLGSVTHSLDANQRLVELAFEAGQGIVTVTAPADGNACPPGYHMVFALSTLGVPSVAHVMRFGPGAGPQARPATMPKAMAARRRGAKAAAAAPRGTHVTAGLTSRCPYGLAACWAGAYQSLGKLSGISHVEDQADAETSTASLWLRGRTLPDIQAWVSEFKANANASYDIRGFEVTVSGTLLREGGSLSLKVGRDTVRLEPLGDDEKVQWDWGLKAPARVTPDEAAAYRTLLESPARRSARITVTGQLLVRRGDRVIALRQVGA